MTPRPWILAECTFAEIRGRPTETVLLPWGATEPHNYHLPYGTDTIQSEAIAAESARRAWEAGARVRVLPAVPFGVQTGQLDLPLTLNLNPSTQALLLRDLVLSLDGQGIRKLVLLNGHGGNDFRQMIRELQPATRIFLSVINWYKVADPASHFSDLGDHAGELETSVMAVLAPELVRPLAEAGDGAERKSKLTGIREGWAWAPRQWSKVTDDTGIGDPRAATAAKGARYLELVHQRIADYLVELETLDPASPYR